MPLEILHPAQIFCLNITYSTCKFYIKQSILDFLEDFTYIIALVCFADPVEIFKKTIETSPLFFQAFISWFYSWFYCGGCFGYLYNILWFMLFSAFWFLSLWKVPCKKTFLTVYLLCKIPEFAHKIKFFSIWLHYQLLSKILK